MGRRASQAESTAKDLPVLSFATARGPEDSVISIGIVALSLGAFLLGETAKCACRGG